MLEDGKPLWRLSERDFEHLATLTRRMDRELTLSAGTLLEFQETGAARRGPVAGGVLELRGEGFPLSARVGGFTVGIPEVTLNVANGQIGYSGLLSFGGKSVQFN